MESPSDSWEFGPFIFLENGHGRLLQFPGTGKLNGYLVTDRRSGQLAQLQLIESNEDPIKAILHVSAWRQSMGDFPVIPKVLDCGIDDQIPYYAAEIPRGEPLHYYLTRARPWPLETAARCVLGFVRELIERPPFCVYRHALSLQSVWLEQTEGDWPRLMLGDLWLDSRPDAPFKNAELFSRILAKLTRGSARDQEFASLCQKIESCSGTLEYIEQCLGDYLDRFRDLGTVELAPPDQPENYRVKMQPAKPLIDVRFTPKLQAAPSVIVSSYQLSARRRLGGPKFLAAARLLLAAGGASFLFYHGFPLQAFRISHAAPIAGAGALGANPKPSSALSLSASVPSFNPPPALRSDSMKVEERISLLHQTIKESHRPALNPSEPDSNRTKAEEARKRRDYYAAVRLETEALRADPQNAASRQRLDSDLFYLYYVGHKGLTAEERETLEAAAVFNTRAAQILERR